MLDKWTHLRSDLSPGSKTWSSIAGTLTDICGYKHTAATHHLIAGYFHCRANKLKHTGYHLNRTAPSVSHVSSHRSCPDCQRLGPAVTLAPLICTGTPLWAPDTHSVYSLFHVIVFFPLIENKNRTKKTLISTRLTFFFLFFFKLTARGSRKAACQRSQDTDVQLDLWAVQNGWKSTLLT